MLSALLALLLLVSPVSGSEAIDVSAHNPSISHILGAENLSAVFIRGSYGNLIDSKYATHASVAAHAGVPFYAYLFLRPSKAAPSPEAQVDAFLSATRNARGFAVDWEADNFITRDGALGSNGRAPLSELRRAVAEFHRQGLRVGVYASELAPFPEAGQDWDWVANYSHRPRIHFDVWQYQGVGVDRDVIVVPLTALDARPAPDVPNHGLVFITANYYDCSSLPSITAHKGAKIADLQGNVWAVLSHDTKLCSAGLADGHSGQYVALITTARYSPDHKASWRVWQIVSGGVN